MAVKIAKFMRCMAQNARAWYTVVNKDNKLTTITDITGLTEGERYGSGEYSSRAERAEIGAA